MRDRKWSTTSVAETCLSPTSSRMRQAGSQVRSSFVISAPALVRLGAAEGGLPAVPMDSFADRWCPDRLEVGAHRVADGEHPRLGEVLIGDSEHLSRLLGALRAPQVHGDPGGTEATTPQRQHEAPDGRQE